MYATSLDPVSGQSGDFSTKFLNANAAGAAVWVWKVKNYLATPIYVTVDISRVVNADISRNFVERNGLTNFRVPSVRTVCGALPCTLAVPSTVYPGTNQHPELPQRYDNVKFRARFFAMNGAATGAEIAPCAGCTNDDDLQTYTFQIPARTTPQGAPLVEYAVLTYMRPTLPAGMGASVLMAPSNAESPDMDPSPYREFIFEGETLTGKLIGGPTGDVCVDQDQGPNGWECTQKASRQRYRAVTSVSLDWRTDVDTTYKFSATPNLPRMFPVIGTLSRDALNTWLSSETGSLP
jgi:hypothetical protein